MTGYFTLFIHSRIGFDTEVSGVSKANTSDMWLCSLAKSIAGQWPVPSLALSPSSLHISSCSALSDASMSPITPGSSSARTSMIFTGVALKPGRLSRSAICSGVSC